MEHDPRTERRARWAAGFFVLAGSSWLWLTHGRPRDSNTFLPDPPPRAALDLAVACLAEGQSTPSVSELSDADLTLVTRILGQLVQSYVQADFVAFLALRRGDLDRRSGSQDLLEPLASLCRELGMKEQDIPAGWLERLEAFWRRYYAEPPARVFLPEDARVALREGVIEPATLEVEFKARVDGHTGAVLHHRLVIPHERGLEELAGEFSRWLDLELAYEPQDGGIDWLIARFVWDGREEEWFLQRATTVSEGERRADRRHLLL